MCRELGTTFVCGEHYDVAMVAESAEVVVRLRDSQAVYMKGRVLSETATDLPEEFDDAIRKLMRNKPR